MLQQTVDMVVVARTGSTTLAQSSHGICDRCIERLQNHLRKVLRGLSYDLDAVPFSHIIVKIERGLSDHRCGRLVYAVNAAINGCPSSHEYDES